MSTTSVGRGPASGGNENHDGDPTHKTLGESVQQEPPAGNELIDQDVGDGTLESDTDQGKVPPS